LLTFINLSHATPARNISYSQPASNVAVTIHSPHSFNIIQTSLSLTEENMSKSFSNKRPRMNDNSEIKPEKDFTFTRTKFPLPFVTKLKINDWTTNWNVHRVSINTGSQADILYMSLFSKFGISESMLKPCDAYLKINVIGFGQGVSVKGYIDLDTTFGTKPNAKTIEVRYFIVDDSQSASAYNVVIGLPTLKDLKAVISIEDLTVEFLVGKGKVGVVKGDLEMAKNCCGIEVTLPMVIKLQINNSTVLRVSVNEGSSANILYWSTFLKMGLEESMLKPFEGFLKGTFGDGVPSKGTLIWTQHSVKEGM